MADTPTRRGGGSKCWRQTMKNQRTGKSRMQFAITEENKKRKQIRHAKRVAKKAAHLERRKALGKN